MIFPVNALPVPLKDMASVPYGNTFLLVGGNNAHTFEDSPFIYKFDLGSDTFKVVTSARLNRARRYTAAVWVDAQAFPDC